MAVHTNDVVLLSSSSCLGKFCENLPMKIISITPFTKKVLFLADNSLSYGKASAKVVKDVLKDKFIFIDSVVLCWPT